MANLSKQSDMFNWYMGNPDSIMKEKDVMIMFGFGLGWKLGPYIFVIVLFFKKNISLQIQ